MDQKGKDRFFNQKMAEMYLQKKMSCRQIAEALGTTRGAVNQALKRNGVPMRTHKEGMKVRFPEGRFGKDAARWKGGKNPVNGIYIYVHKPDHPCATKGGYVMEHRLVMEKKLGRQLLPKEIVHHINGDGKDNRPENLEIQDRSTHVHNHFAHGREVMKMEETIRRQKAKIRQLQYEVKRLKAKIGSTT